MKKMLLVILAMAFMLSLPVMTGVCISKCIVPPGTMGIPKVECGSDGCKYWNGYEWVYVAPGTVVMETYEANVRVLCMPRN